MQLDINVSDAEAQVYFFTQTHICTYTHAHTYTHTPTHMQLDINVSDAEAQGLFTRFGYDSIMPYDVFAHHMVSQPNKTLGVKTAGTC